MIESITVVLLLLFVANLVIMRVCYRRINSKSSKPATIKVADVPEDRVMLHDHDLAKWNYLGHTACSYVDESGKTTGVYNIFLFVDKKNEKRRSFCIPSDIYGHVAKSHTYVNNSIKPWAAGEGNVYSHINGKRSRPSDYLKEYMLDAFNAEWDETTHWWGTSDKAKYTAAQNKQKREHAVTETVPESNVITVEFGKQA